jgi:hypothetical protein
MNRWLTIIFFIALAGIVLITQTGSQTFGDADGFYHAKMALLLKDGIIPQQFPWLSQTVLADRFADQHFLYHAALVPFVLWKPILGVNIFNTIIVLLAAGTIWFYLKKSEIKQPLLWLFLIFLASPGFMFRFQLTKAVQLGLIFLIVATLLLRSRKPWMLALLAFVFTLTYGGFIFLLPLLGFYFVAQIIEREKIDYKLYLLPLLGMALALLIHPYDNILPVLYDQIFETGLRQQIPVGGEWYAPTFESLMGSAGIILVLWLIAVIVWARSKIKNTEVLFLLLASTCFIFLNLKSQRFLEYSIPFAGMFAAFVLHPYLNPNWSTLKNRFKDIKYTLVPIVIGLVSLMIILGMRVVINYRLINDLMAPQKYDEAMQAVAADSNSGDIVFNTGWDQFPQLFLANHKNYYITGLDPTFMYIKNKERYWLWRHLSEDKINVCQTDDCKDKPTRLADDVLTAEFNARYVVLEPRYHITI